MKQHIMIVVVSAMLLSALTNGRTQAAVVLFSGTGSGSTLRDNYSGTVGARITPTNSILVTQLGYWDQDGLGLATNHQVGIWTDTGGSPLGSVTVQTNSTLIGVYRYALLTTPITLTNGVTYRIGAEVMDTSGDAWLEKSAGDYTVGAPVIINQRAYSGSGAGFAFPVNAAAGVGLAYIAPNFISEVLVPEPSALLLCGVGGMLAWWRRKQTGR